MGNQAAQLNESRMTEEERQREHLEGLARERLGHPYSKAEFLRERRIFEEYERHVQADMRVYGNYTLFVLDFVRELDLEKNHEWNSTLKHIDNEGFYKNIVWGHVTNHSQRVVVFMGNIHFHRRRSDNR